MERVLKQMIILEICAIITLLGVGYMIEHSETTNCGHLFFVFANIFVISSTLWINIDQLIFFKKE